MNKKKVTLFLQMILCLCVVLGMAACNGKIPETANNNNVTIEQIEPSGEIPTYSCQYNGQSREYMEYAPEGNVKGVILLLHGYGSDAKAFRSDIKMEEDALDRGYVIVYVTGSANENDHTSAAGWNSGIGDSPNDDIGYLKALAGYMQEKYGITRDNTFAAGFSNGGFMMYRIAVEGQDVFAGVASVAGMMPEKMWNARKQTAQISVLQINGSKDDVVPMHCNGTANNNKAPAIEDVIDYFAEANGLTQEQAENLSEKSVLTKHYADSKQEQVWQILIQEGRHSWPAEKSCGFNVNCLILDFFDTVMR